MSTESIIEQLQDKLANNFLSIPTNYYTFCLIAYHMLQDGEDLNTLLTFVNNLTNYNVSIKNTVENFVENCSEEALTNELKVIYEEQNERYQRLRAEIDAEPRAEFEEGEIMPEWA